MSTVDPRAKEREVDWGSFAAAVIFAGVAWFLEGWLWVWPGFFTAMWLKSWQEKRHVEFNNWYEKNYKVEK